MLAGHGLRSRARDLLSGSFMKKTKKGYLSLMNFTRAETIEENGGNKMNRAIEKCFPVKKLYHGSTGKAWNLTSGTTGFDANKQLHFRFSTASETSIQYNAGVEFLSFVESTLDDLEGPHHCWLNKPEESEEPFKRNGPFLVLAGVFSDDSTTLASDHIVMLERVKLLQRRHPQLRVFGFQSVGSACSVASQTQIVQTIIKEYITFPILLSSRSFSEVAREACYIAFNDFKSTLRLLKETADLGTINSAIKELSMVDAGNALVGQISEGKAMKKPDVVKEPYISCFRNILLYHPGCVSVDENGDRLFISDSNHHRIIILDRDGKILDSIGSSPGFEDGEFESAKLFRPACSFYHAAEDFLYFVDSENCAVRKAHIGSRTVETLYPTSGTDAKLNGIWSWIVDKLGVKREVNPKSMELDSLIIPWHLIVSENKLFVLNRSFQTLWIMDATSGNIKEVVTGHPNVNEICGKMIVEKSSLPNQITEYWLQHNVDRTSPAGPSLASFMSSVATAQNDIIFCDTVGQVILKYHRKSGVISNFQLSNFGILGLPYWLSYPLERVSLSGDLAQRPHVDHFQCFSCLPGKCGIKVSVRIPEDTELAASLQEGSIWRQARGSAAEVFGEKSKQKVDSAQIWYEEIDNLSFSNAETESTDQANENQDRNFQQDKVVDINCAVNVSPGTSEIIIYAVIYLKLNRNSGGNCREERAKRILDIIDHDRRQKHGSDACIKLMLESSRDIGELIFMKPLHLRLTLECQDHPKADTSKEVILTDSVMKVNVSLK